VLFAAALATNYVCPYAGAPYARGGGQLAAGATMGPEWWIGMAPSPSPWVLGTVYQDAACSIPWAVRTQRWDRLDTCQSPFGKGIGVVKTSNATHLHTRMFTNIKCIGKARESWIKLGACTRSNGEYFLAKPAAAPEPLPNTLVQHYSNAADCSSLPVIVETYPANQVRDLNQSRYNKLTETYPAKPVLHAQSPRPVPGGCVRQTDAKPGDATRTMLRQHVPAHAMRGHKHHAGLRVCQHQVHLQRGLGLGRTTVGQTDYAGLGRTRIRPKTRTRTTGHPK
jgi:hypothetical protein